jgi:hypothetical protein
VLAHWYYPTITSEVIRVVVYSAGRISAQSVNFLLPTAAELRATITACKITHVVEVDFYITGHNIVF